jgi:serine protein kinase
MEETIERIVGFFRHAAQGLEERKQILYLLGPVGGGKSSLAERLKSLMEVHPIYVLKAGDELSPVFESPLSLFDPESLGPMLEEKYGIPRRRLTGLMSPWCYKRLEAFGGDISQFRVARIQPSRLRQIAIAKTEPGDENNQDISSLVGKVDIRKLETFAQNDPDAYSYSGGLNRANQGVLEFVEMFKAPIKMLHPLLTATQEGNYIGTENIGAIPFTGVILRAFQRIRMAKLQDQQEQRGLHRSYLRHQGAVLPAGHRRAEDLREADPGIRTGDRAVCAGDAGNPGAFLGDVAPAQA